jgi:GH35 family endo-1,4-beta-xylanase
MASFCAAMLWSGTANWLHGVCDYPRCTRSTEEVSCLTMDLSRIIVESTTWTNETLIAAMTNHITKVAKHFKGRCAHWDVLNEGRS